MQCQGCGHENSEGMKFCVECATPLKNLCPGCSFENPPHAKFCGDCATPISGQRPPELPPAARDPRDYTPKHLAEKILSSKSALEGERKQITVLFADVKGSLDLAEQVDPEEWHRILNKFFEILTDGVHHFEGTINQYTGDGIMALFGAPIAHEDHAQRACYAALRLVDELRVYSRTLRLERGLNFSVRMGINSGEVVVGKIGDDLRMDYTAQGHTVGLAARMEQLAEPGKIYLTEHTAAHVTGFFELEDLGPVEAKGASKPVRVFELQGVGPMRTRMDVSRARGLSRFVGRDGEMQILEAALKRALAGTGQVVGIVAEAGTGKSRLCFEFTESCRAQGLSVREAHGVSHGKSIPFLPILEFMRDFFGITDRDTEEEARHKVAGRVLLLDESAKDALPILFDFLGITDPRQAAKQTGDDSGQRQLLGVVRRLMEARSRQEPAVVLFEDLHWIDQGSQMFIEHVAETVPATRTLLILNYRPEFHAHWMNRSNYHQIPLQPLSPEDITALIGDLLGEDSSLARLPERIRERTGGNPFFIEEVIQALVDGESLRGNKGSYKLVKPVEAVQIPSTVQTVLTARIDRLPEREKQVLQTAAVIGKTFTDTLLKQVSDLPDPERNSALQGLSQGEFIYQAALYPETEYAFKHPLTQEMAYRSQLSGAKAGVHGRVAKAIEEEDPSKRDERAALIAHHWEGAGDSLQALRWHARAAKWTGPRDPAECVRHWRNVRVLLEEVPESDETLTLGAEARATIMAQGARVGDIGEEAAELLDEGEKLARRTGDLRSHVQLLLGAAAVKFNEGKVTETTELFGAAARLAGEIDDRGLKLATRALVTATLTMRGSLDRALSRIDEVLKMADGDFQLGAEYLMYSPCTLLLIMRSVALMEMGRPLEARRDIEKAIEASKSRNEVITEALANSFAVNCAAMAGDFQGALNYGRECLQIAENLGVDQLLAIGHSALGRGELVNEQFEKAVENLDRGLRISVDRQVNRYAEGWSRTQLADALLGLGEASRAHHEAERAVEICNQQGLKGFECLALQALALALLRLKGADAQSEIEAHLARAKALADEGKFWGHYPYILQVRAELAALLGDDAARRRHLSEARSLFAKMGAQGHVARLAKELGL